MREALAGLGLVAMAVAVVLVVLVDRDAGPAAPPFSVSESEVPAECLTGTFIPTETGLDLLKGKPPANWRVVETAPGAIQAERGAVLVTLRPKSGTNEIALTGIKFKVENLGLRPPGNVFYRPCKQWLKGAVIESNLDRSGRVLGSDASLHGTLEKGFFLPGHSQPIHFPWTVSLQQPLRLYLVVQAYDIWCKWSARIGWDSGSSHGVIRIDNGGKEYEAVDGAGSPWYRPRHGTWVAQGASRWIGVR